MIELFATVRTLQQTVIRSSLKLQNPLRHMLPEIMTPKLILCFALVSATGIRASQCLWHFCLLIGMLRHQMVFQHLLCSCLVRAVLALVLQRTTVLCINMHIHRALILLGVLTVRALKQTFGSATIGKPLLRRRSGHF